MDVCTFSLMERLYGERRPYLKKADPRSVALIGIL